MYQYKLKVIAYSGVFILVLLLVYGFIATHAVRSLQVRVMLGGEAGPPEIFWEFCERPGAIWYYFFFDEFRSAYLIIDNGGLYVQLYKIEVTNRSVIPIEVQKIELSFYIDNIPFGRHELRELRGAQGNAVSIAPCLIPPRTTYILGRASPYSVTLSVSQDQMGPDQLELVQWLRENRLRELRLELSGSLRASAFVYSNTIRFRLVEVIEVDERVKIIENERIWWHLVEEKAKTTENYEPVWWFA
jgi:hypothetical protein